MADLTTIKNWFKTGLKPTQLQFWTTWDSFWHKSENIPANKIEGLSELLNVKSNVGHTHSITDINGWQQSQNQDLKSVLSNGREGDYMFLSDNQIGTSNNKNVVYGHNLDNGGQGNELVYLGSFRDNGGYKNIISLGANVELAPRASDDHQLIINTNGHDILFNTDVRQRLAFDLPLASGRLALEKASYVTFSFVAEQSEHDAPTMRILTNELGLPDEAFHWTYFELGRYALNCERPIFKADTFIFISEYPINDYTITARVQNDESIGFVTHKDGRPEDGVLNRSIMVELRIYGFEQVTGGAK